MIQASASCLVLLMQLMPWAFVFDLLRAGSSIAARMAIMAMTTNSSINVKAPAHRLAQLLARSFVVAEAPMKERIWHVAADEIVCWESPKMLIEFFICQAVLLSAISKASLQRPRAVVKED